MCKPHREWPNLSFTFPFHLLVRCILKIDLEGISVQHTTFCCPQSAYSGLLINKGSLKRGFSVFFHNL